VLQPHLPHAHVGASPRARRLRITHTDESSSRSAVTPDSFSIELSFVRATKVSTVPLARQLRSIANPSSDELMFLACPSELGPDLAQRLAVAHHWMVRRSVVEAMHGHVRSQEGF